MTAEPCSINGEDARTKHRDGKIDGNQAVDTNYNAASQAQQSFAVGKGTQTINFTSTAPGSATMRADFGATA